MTPTRPTLRRRCRCVITTIDFRTLRPFDRRVIYAGAIAGDFHSWPHAGLHLFVSLRRTPTFLGRPSVRLEGNSQAFEGTLCKLRVLLAFALLFLVIHRYPFTCVPLAAVGYSMQVGLRAFSLICSVSQCHLSWSLLFDFWSFSCRITNSV